MKFSHLVEINNPLHPLIVPLTREQLWHGLVLRAEDPKMFVPWLDACAIVERSATSITRELRYGELVICDHVTFAPQHRVDYLVPAQQDIPTSSLSMTIEARQTDVLLVRFEYRDDSPDVEGTEEAFYNEFRRSAYLESDIDTIRVIRQLAENGTLGGANL